MSEPKTITSDYTAKPGDNLIADATDGPITVTLPPLPSHGDVKIEKVGDHPVTISPGRVLTPGKP